MATRPAPSGSTPWPSSASRPRVAAAEDPRPCSWPTPRAPPPADKGRAAREAYYSGDVKKALTWPRPPASPGSPASPPSACRPTPRPGPISSGSPTTTTRTNGCARPPPSGPRARRPPAARPRRRGPAQHGRPRAQHLLRHDRRPPVGPVRPGPGPGRSDRRPADQGLLRRPRHRLAGPPAGRRSARPPRRRPGPDRPLGRGRPGAARRPVPGQRRSQGAGRLDRPGPGPERKGPAERRPRRCKRVGGEDYPLPPLEPKGGFTIDKAMVYALVRQESRFDPYAVSAPAPRA
jgi:hypothetical protein